ncbi:hypothetical protein QZH41_000096 [Actinostola sp. cb2023]|nr:hypothetical protein QZH41_000096 [Actinostola sp. cb2023]
MAVSELPVSITEPKPHTSYDYFAHKYGHKTVVEFKDDLNAIDKSLHKSGSPKMKRKTTRRHKKAKRFPSLSLVPNLEDISENEESLSFELDVEKKKKDLATIHKERAMTSGNYGKQEGRSFRHKRYHKTSSKD